MLTATRSAIEKSRARPLPGRGPPRIWPTARRGSLRTDGHTFPTGSLWALTPELRVALPEVALSNCAELICLALCLWRAGVNTGLPHNVGIGNQAFWEWHRYWMRCCHESQVLMSFQSIPPRSVTCQPRLSKHTIPPHAQHRPTKPRRRMLCPSPCRRHAASYNQEV